LAFWYEKYHLATLRHTWQLTEPLSSSKCPPSMANAHCQLDSEKFDFFSNGSHVFTSKKGPSSEAGLPVGLF
jgi:hypothetical protein